MATFRPNPRFRAELRRWLARQLGDIVDLAVKEAKRFAPADTGTLRERMEAVRSGENVYIKLPFYGLYQELGTGIYGAQRRYITPRRARFLAWRVRAKDKKMGKYPGKRAGDWVFAKRVRGVPARHFLERGFKVVFKAIEISLKEALRGRP